MTKPEKSPAFQFYPKDWITDINIIMMTPEERGLYIMALCHDWLEDGLTEEQLGKLCMASKGTSRLVQERFVPHPSNPGKFTNPRLQREREKQSEWKEKCRRGGINSGRTRHYASKGTSDLVRSKREVKGNSPSSSSSSSSNKERESPPVLKTWPGCKFIRTTVEEYNQLVKKFGHDLLKQEIPDADLWIEKAETPNARKYRMPSHNHYLFLRTTWLKDKRLKTHNPLHANGAHHKNQPISKRGLDLAAMAMPKVNR